MDTAVTDEICRRLIEGESMRSICKADGMPDKATVCRWLAADEEFRGQYAAARQMQADALADEILDISDDGSNDWMDRETASGGTIRVIDNEHVQRSRLRVDSRKWLASKLAPKKYGDATLLKHGDADGGPIREMTHVERVTRLASIMDSALKRGELNND
jgi:hypothetical protein